MSAPPVPRPRAIDRLAARFGIDRFELGVLAALSALSVFVLAALLTRGRPLSGADGVLATDQLQYLAWIREASEHWLIGNRFDLAPGERVFLHPGFLLSGLAHRVLGISIPLAYLLWKPVAVALAFFATLAYVRRLLDGMWRRRIALVIALFAVMPASAFVAWTGWGGKPRQFTFDFISGEMWTGQFLWGYLMTAIAVFLMPLVLLGVESWRESRRARTLALASAGALVVCWLQPWQGATLAGIVVAVAALRYARSREGPTAAPFAIAAAVALPAIYYFVLSVTDPAWELAGDSNAAGAQTSWSWPWWAMALTVAPLAVPAALAYRLPAPSWQEQAVRIWPFAALAVYLQPFGTFPYHALQGIAIPLAILAVQGVASRWPRPRPAFVAAALVLLIVPGSIHKADVARNSVHTAGDPYFIFDDEVRALDWLENDPRAGGVLSPAYAGHMLPYTTGRESYIGPFSWTPDWEERERLTRDLFEGDMAGEEARRFVASSRARFVFVDCRPGLRDITAEIRPLVEEVRRFGCATVWVLNERPEQAAAAGPPDA